MKDTILSSKEPPATERPTLPALSAMLLAESARRFGYIRMPELLDELSVARACGDFKKTVKKFQQVDLLILDEWLIRCLAPNESYDLLEIIEARCSHGATIFCTQFEVAGWYKRINPDPESDSPISEAIMDRIKHNAYDILIDGENPCAKGTDLIRKNDLTTRYWGSAPNPEV